MFGRRLIYTLTFFGCVIFYWAHQQWVSWILLLTVIAFPWLSALLSLPAMVSLRLVPGAPVRMQTGARETAVLIGTCRQPQPPVRGKIRVERPLTGEKWTIRPGDALPSDHCGGLLLTPHRAKVFDYAGLVRRRIRRVDTAAVTVLPRPVEFPVPPDLSRYLARAWRPKFGGGYAENHELRLYRPGDGLNQVHWKLTAKTGKLIIREPMEPERGLMLLTMDVKGNAAQLDEKFGKLLWLADYLLEQGVSFEIRAMTGAGLQSCPVVRREDLDQAMHTLLCSAPAGEGSVKDLDFAASWQYHIGGEPDEV